MHLKYDNLEVSVFDSRAEMGKEAARLFANNLRELLAQKQEVRLIFAAAPSQNDFISALLQEKNIAWNRVIAFHMDEYLGLPINAKQSFQYFLKTKLFQHLPFKKVHYIIGQSANTEKVCLRYSQLLKSELIDLVALGIGENGHIAFNDPPVANFTDPRWVKVVTLDNICRNQQVNDGAFKDIIAVPKQAITLSIPALMSATALFCIVPGSLKAPAVRATLLDTIATKCPASILRTHSNAQLFLDKAAFADVDSTTSINK
jgi:glucosamine-6-phosphate deaminase